MCRRSAVPITSLKALYALFPCIQYDCWFCRFPNMVSLIWADSGAEGLWRVYGAGLCLKEYEGHVPRSNVSDRGKTRSWTYGYNAWILIELRL